MTGASAERNPASETKIIVATPLDDLLDNLIAANKILEEDCRLSAFESLNAVWKFLYSIPSTIEHRRPIVALLNAFESLDEGITLPMLKRKAGGPGRRRTSAAHNCMKGMVAATAERLQSTGMARDESYRCVAKTCNRAGFAPGRGRNPTVTNQTVRCWREEIEADPQRRSDAARTFDQLMQSWADMPTAPAGDKAAAVLQRDLLESLHQTLRSLKNN
ncbi:MAG TPA: hypothetical protein VGP28_09970 [Methylocella sp.]|jgi:hypothetical protein|nr:hypothetical protein [Methylocella sp.]